MPALGEEAYERLLVEGCPACHRRYLRMRAFGTGTIQWLEGEKVSSVTWSPEAPALHDRVYRVECSECSHVAFTRDDCPLCHAAGGIARALASRHGVTPPRHCPRCAYEELKITVELRMHVDTILGRVSRRVVDAEPHEGGFHILRAECESCVETVAAASLRCAMCGRSNLLKRP